MHKQNYILVIAKLLALEERISIRIDLSNNYINISYGWITQKLLKFCIKKYRRIYLKIFFFWAFPVQ
jgi:hypothetical protein